ncbi:MAG: hypothetical protein NVS3B7_18430 [Candidatus Elarobacter sp.]
MKLTRIAALVAVPVAFSLAACTSGSSTPGVANFTGTQANLRVLNADPSDGSFDIYFQSTGTGAPASPLIGNLQYGVASDFANQPATGANLLVQTKGGPAPSTNSPQLASCPLPQLTVNAKYTIAVVRSATAVNCRLFQEFDYTAAPQYRFHNASASNGAGGTGLTFGTTANPSSGTPFVVQGVARAGTLAAGTSGATGFTPVTPVLAVAVNVKFSTGTGASSATVGGSDVAQTTLDSSKIFGSGSLNQPNTTGNLNYTGTVGTSLFAIDCTAAAVAPLTGVTCAGGIALVGETDRL